MKSKNVVLRIDDENGIKNITLKEGGSEKTVSLSDEGCNFLDSLGADIVLDFDSEDNLVGIELMGL